MQLKDLAFPCRSLRTSRKTPPPLAVLVSVQDLHTSLTVAKSPAAHHYSVVDGPCPSLDVFQGRAWLHHQQRAAHLMPRLLTEHPAECMPLPSR